MLLKKIESIRKKPQEVRKRYAFWYAVFFTSGVLIFWVVSIPSKLNFSLSIPSEETQKVQGSIARSFSNLRASLSQYGSEDSQERTLERSFSTSTQNATPDKEMIDFSTFFDSSTSQQVVSHKNTLEPEKRVLIGTTSILKNDFLEN